MAVVEVRNLTKYYKSFNQFIAKQESYKAVDNISFDIEPGEILGFLGPNGAGKTTTIKIVAGLILPDKGSVIFPNKNQNIGVVLEGARNIYWRLTVWENLIYYGGLRNLPYKQLIVRSKQLLDEFGLADRAQKPVQTLSRGMQQKLAIIIAILHNPELILLDEPTLGLDVMSTRAIKTRIKYLAHNENKAILITTHQMELAQQICDRIVIFNKGQIIAVDTPRGLRSILDHTDLELSLFCTDWELVKNNLAVYKPIIEDSDFDTLDLRMSLINREQIFGITEILKQEKVVPIRLSMGDPNLEDVFVSLIAK